MSSASTPVAHPALVRAVLDHLPALEARFRSGLGLQVAIGRSYRLRANGSAVVTLTLKLDEQSDTLRRDEREALREGCAHLRHMGFYADVAEGCRLVVTGYYGSQRQVAA